MKLHLTATSERGKPVEKTANDFLRIHLTVGNSQEQANAGVIELIETSPNKYAIKYHLNGKTKLLQEINTRGTVFENKSKTARECPQCNGNDTDCPRHWGEEKCQKHGIEYMEQHKLDGHYICRACVIEGIK